MRIAEAALAALEQQRARAGMIEIGDQHFAVFLEDLRADGDTQNRIGTGGACHLLAHAVLAVPGLDVLREAIVDEGIQILHSFRPHIAATPAIAAVGAAELDELLAAKRDAAVSARAARD